MDPLVDIYTPLASAVTTALARVGRPALLRGDGLAERLAARPHAVWFRHVATPNFEQRMFRQMARATGMVPLVLEYHHDKFVTRNLDKLSLARMSFFDGLGRNGGHRIRVERIACLPDMDGLPLDQVRTHWGQGLIEFHHELLRQDPFLADVEQFDASEWFADHGGTARQYYVDLLAMFTGCSILIDTFWLTGNDREFTQQVVLPAFAQAARLGRRPLVCRTYPESMDGEPNWARYPGPLAAFVRAKLNSTSNCGRTAAERLAVS